MPNGRRNGQKARTPAAVQRTVGDVPSGITPGSDQSFVVWVAQVADAIAPWGQAPKVRDRQLREFITLESYFASALASVCARNAAFDWTLEGGDRTVRRVQEMLLNANRGLGWIDFVVSVSMDAYTQDMGAFVEIIREGDSETAPVINVAHLDAARCYPTGNPETPVYYQDGLGKWHALMWYQVVQLREMSAPAQMGIMGVLYKLQYSVLTRVLRAAQIIRNVSTYQEEKTGGRFMRQLHLLKGIVPKQVEEAMQQYQQFADAQGLTRYVQPAMIGSVDPNADVGHDTIELASLPDGFDIEKTLKWYIAAMALAFGVDYQEFAPLPGGNLGTGAQSEMLHLKTRGKGPALFQKLFTHMMNFQGVLPQNVTFRFTERDLSAEEDEAAVRLRRAQTRQIQVLNGELDARGAAQLALDNGDMPQEVFNRLHGTDVTPDTVAHDEERPDDGEDGERVEEDERAKERKPVEPPGRADLEDDVRDEMERVLNRVRRRVNRYLRDETEPEPEAKDRTVVVPVVVNQSGGKKVVRLQHDPKTRQVVGSTETWED